MAVAVCVFCGERKAGPLSTCKHCGKKPRGSKQSTKSMMLSRKFLNNKRLEDVQNLLRQGEAPFDTSYLRERYERLLPQLEFELGNERAREDWRKQRQKATDTPPQLMEFTGEPSEFEETSIVARLWKQSQPFLVIWLIYPFFLMMLLAFVGTSLPRYSPYFMGACVIWLACTFIPVSYRTISRLSIVTLRFALPAVYIALFVIFGFVMKSDDIVSAIFYLGVVLSILNLTVVRLSNQRTLIVRYMMSLGGAVGFYAGGAVIIFSVVGGLIYSENFSSNATKEQTQRVIASQTSDVPRLTDKQERAVTDHLVHELKKTMHNPDRFEVVKTSKPRLTVTKEGERLVTIDVRYRAENGFGALRTQEETYTILEDGAIYQGEAYKVIGDALRFQYAHPELFPRE